MHLAPNICLARIDRRYVVLDLNRDRYIGLNANLSDALERLSSSPHEETRMPEERRRAITKLLKQGILIATGEPKSRGASQPEKASQATAPEPASSLWAQLPDERTSNKPISITGMMSALFSLTQVATSLQFRSFKSTIDWLAKTKATPLRHRADRSAQAWGSAQALVDAFNEVRPYFPLKPICRLDSPSMCLHLRRNGHYAQLVFGVRLDPFAAHCWVQIGEVAINEAWDRVRQYTPILVV